MTEVQSLPETFRTEYVLGLLYNFTETGDKLTLQQIYDIFASRNHVPVPIPPELAMDVSMKIFTLIEIEHNNYYFWGLLSYLMNHHYNLYAKDYLLLLQKSPILVRFLYYLTINLSILKHDIRNLIKFLDFLQQLVVDSYERQSILFNQNGQHVLKAVANIFKIAGSAFQETAGLAHLLSDCVWVISLLAELHPEAIERNDHRSILWFLNMGGISILSKLFMTATSNIYMSPQMFCVVRRSLFKVFNSLEQLNTTGLDRELYCIDRNSAYRMNVAFYKLLSEDKKVYLSYTLSFLHIYTIYLQHYDLASVLESLLLYKPPGKNANSTLVRKILKYVRCSNCENSTAFEIDFIEKFNIWENQFPAVAALLDEPLRELPPDRDDKVRVCSYPGCNIDGKGLFNKMMKCGRCRSVYYCGLWHQREHWKVHKQTCTSSTAVTTTATPSTGVSTVI